MERIRRFFDIRYFLKESQIQGEIPSNNKVYRKAYNIAWPSMMEMILVSLIGSMDLIMVSGLGSSAIAAVGITNQPKFIIMATVMALNTGVTVLVARRRGENNRESANQVLRNAIVIGVVLSFVLSVIGFMFAREINLLAGANTDYIDLAVVYFQYIMIGNFFTLIGLTLTAAQRGAGNTKISMRTNLTANLVNIVFNYLLINGIWIFPEWGVKGAAIATMLGNIVGCLMAIYSVSHKEQFLHLSLKHNWLPHKETLRQLFKISSASFIEQIFIRIGFFTYARAVAGLGTLEFATHQVCMNVVHFTFSVGEGLSVASSSLVGQNLGAKRPDMAMIYSKALQRVGLIISIILGIFIAIFRIPILSLFSQSDVNIVHMGDSVMLVIAVIVSMQVIQVITMGSLRGSGDLKFVALLMIISVTILRPTLTYVLAYSMNFGLIGAWSATLVDQIIRNVSSQIRFSQGKWMKIKI